MLSEKPELFGQMLIGLPGLIQAFFQALGSGGIKPGKRKCRQGSDIAENGKVSLLHIGTIYERNADLVVALFGLTIFLVLQVNGG